VGTFEATARAAVAAAAGRDDAAATEVQSVLNDLLYHVVTMGDPAFLHALLPLVKDLHGCGRYVHEDVLVLAGPSRCPG
jgi:hypothetical protein